MAVFILPAKWMKISTCYDFWQNRDSCSLSKSSFSNIRYFFSYLLHRKNHMWLRSSYAESFGTLKFSPRWVDHFLPFWYHQNDYSLYIFLLSAIAFAKWQFFQCSKFCHCSIIRCFFFRAVCCKEQLLGSYRKCL